MMDFEQLKTDVKNIKQRIENSEIHKQLHEQYRTISALGQLFEKHRDNLTEIDASLIEDFLSDENRYFRETGMDSNTPGLARAIRVLLKMADKKI